MNPVFSTTRNPLASLWLSAVELYLRQEHPERSIQEIRALPMMQGVFAHIRELNERRAVAEPGLNATPLEGTAFASQQFMTLAVHTAALSRAEKVSGDLGEATYHAYIAVLNYYNGLKDIANFSTDDLGGFALCLIIWLGLTGESYDTWYYKAIVDAFDVLTPERLQKIKNFLAFAKSLHATVQYRSANDYPDYKVTYRLPANAQIIMLGDWGTGMEDSYAFLEAIWRQAYENDRNRPIVFLHLGDIYYCGLETECDEYFLQVFDTVGKKLKKELGGNFDGNATIFTLPGNHEYYSFGYGYFRMLDKMNKHLPGGTNPQRTSFFCLRTQSNDGWQFLGMDTGQDDGNGLESFLQGLGDSVKTWYHNHPTATWFIGGPLVKLAIWWSEDLIRYYYQWLVGPFAPKLRPEEMDWMRARLDKDGFNGRTVLCSHHQLYSRQGQIDYDTPEYINTYLHKSFKPYFKKEVAAWYWGHEHSFALYVDGIMGLNKGRLLGSSSYEATESSDHPYNNRYPMVPLQPRMFDGSGKSIVKEYKGLYYHVGAILQLNKNEISTRYYQYPAWSQFADSKPPAQDIRLTELSTCKEDIKRTSTILEPTWTGDKTIGHHKSGMSPALCSCAGYVYLVYANTNADSHNQNHLAWGRFHADAFKPTGKDQLPQWNAVSDMVCRNYFRPLITSHAPACVVVQQVVHLFYVDADKQSDCYGKLCHASLQHNATVWERHGSVSTSTFSVSTDMAPSACQNDDGIDLIYRKAGSPGNLGWMHYNLTTKVWSNKGQLMRSDGREIQANQPPAIAYSPDHLVMLYKNMNDNGLNCVTLELRKENAWWTPINATPQPLVPDGKKHSSMTTDLGGSLILSQGRMLYAYVCTQEYKMKVSVLDLEDMRWHLDEFVTVSKNSNNPIYPRSDRAPAIAVAGSGCFLIYKGRGTDQLYQSYY